MNHRSGTALRIFAALAFGLSAAPLLAAPPAVVAIVTDVSGKVEAQPAGGKSRPTAVLDELVVGTKLNFAADARAVVIWLASGDELEFTGPAKVEISATEARTESGAPPKKRSVFGNGADLKIRPRGSVQASVLMRASKPEVALVSPVGTKILDPRPTFEWKPVPDVQSSRIEISDDSLQTVAEAAVDGNSFRLPDGVSLKPGVAYTWEVEARAGTGYRVSGWAAFSLASDEERARVESVRPKANASFADRVAFALLLESLELFADAKAVWQALAKERPEDPAIRARVGGESK